VEIHTDVIPAAKIDGRRGAFARLDIHTDAIPAPRSRALGAFDPLAEHAEFCHREVWFHTDVITPAASHALGACDALAEHAGF